MQEGWDKAGSSQDHPGMLVCGKENRNLGHTLACPSESEGFNAWAGWGRVAFREKMARGTPWLKVELWKMGTSQILEDEVIPAEANQNSPLRGGKKEVLLGQKLQQALAAAKKGEARRALGPGHELWRPHLGWKKRLEESWGGGGAKAEGRGGAGGERGRRGAVFIVWW